MKSFDAAAIARLEKRYSGPQVVEQRRRLREILAVRRGERGLDVGCGAGHFLSEVIAEGAAMTGIDVSADAVAATRARCPDADVRQGSADRLDFPDGTFDFVVASQVLCYVAEVERALREARRVLKPGGRLVALDSDWDLCLFRSEDDALTRRLVSARAKLQFAHTDLPRRLTALLKDAGFAEVRPPAVIALVETRYDPESFGAGLLGEMRKAGVKEGIDGAVLAAWEQGMRSRSAEGQWFFSLNRFAFVAR